MNNLNSVLLEGTVETGPVLFYDPEGPARCRFSIRSSGTYKDQDGVVTTVTLLVPVVTRFRLAETCNEYLKKGRSVRLVGRLAPNGTKLSLLAEHVEFRPVLNKELTE